MEDVNNRVLKPSSRDQILLLLGRIEGMLSIGVNNAHEEKLLSLMSILFNALANPPMTRAQYDAVIVTTNVHLDYISRVQNEK